MNFLKGLERFGEKRARQLTRLLAPLITLQHRSHLRRNLEQFFGQGEWSAERRKAFTRAHYDYLARLFAEQAYLGLLPREQARARMSASGLNHVEDALRLGRGVLVVSGHLGNYRFIPPTIGYEGHPVTAVVRAAPFRGNENFFAKRAGRFNVRAVFTYQNAVETCRDALRKNEIVYIAFDAVSFDSTSVRLPFGRSQIDLSRGPALLACRHRLPVIYASALQQPDGITAINLVPAESRMLADMESASPEELTARWLQRLEADVSGQPDQWWEWSFQTLGVPATARARAIAFKKPQVSALDVETTR